MRAPIFIDNQRTFEENQEAILELQRLAGVGTLTASVAHELTNPVNVITATCNNLLSQVADGSISNDELLHYIAMIDQSAWRCARLIRGLRDYSYLNGRNFSKRYLNEIVEAALVLISYELERQDNLVIETDLEPSLDPVACDQNQILQVLVNLMVNARDAMAGNEGVIRIASWSIPDEDAQALSVIDTGPGIDQDVMPNIFEPFVTTKPMGLGTGLGLPIVQKIIEDHHGQITAENNPAGGATFTIILPCQQPD